MWSLTVMAPKVVGVTSLAKFRPIAGLCTMRKELGYLWLNSFLPLRYETDAGLFLLLEAAELSREWQKEIVVAQLDVKNAFDHVEHRAAFKAMRLRSLSPFSMACGGWLGSVVGRGVVGFSVELERVDDDVSSKRQDFELECENGGKRDWCEAPPVDGTGSLVETLAQNWTPLDRDVQHECSALLGRTCGQDGLLGELREGLEMSPTSVGDGDNSTGKK